MISLDVFSTFFRRCERNPSFGEKFHILTGQSRRVGAEGALEVGVDAWAETRCTRRFGAADALVADALAETRCGCRRVGVNALAQTRWWGRVGGDGLWLRRIGVDALAETRCGSDALA